MDGDVTTEGAAPVQQEDPEQTVRRMWSQLTGSDQQTQPEVPGGSGPISQNPTTAAQLQSHLTAQGRAKFAAIQQYEQARTKQATSFLQNPPTEEDIDTAEGIPTAIATRNIPMNAIAGYGRGAGLGLDEATERQLTGYRQNIVARAVAQRTQEEHPDWSPTQVMDAAREEMAHGLPTARGGVRGFLFERAAPLAVEMASITPMLKGLGKIARPLVGLGEKTAGAERVAKSAAAGAISMGAQGLVRAPSLAEQDQAAAANEDPYSLWARVKRGATGALAGATAEGLGATLLPKELADNASLRDKLVNWGKGIPGRAAQGAGMAVAANPLEAVKDPSATLADALIFGLMPNLSLGGGSNHEEVKQAAGQEISRAAAEDGATTRQGLAGAPEWARKAAGEATVATPDDANAAAAGAVERAKTTATEPRVDVPIDPPSVVAARMAAERKAASTGTDPQRWLEEAAHAQDVAAAAAKALQLDPALDAQPQYQKEAAKDLASPGAAESQAQDVASTLADNEIGKVIPQQQPQVAADPTARWEPQSVQALRDLLTTYDRQVAVHQGTESNGDDPRRLALAREMASSKGEIDRILLAHEGRTLEQAQAIPHDSVLWRTSPGLAALAQSRPLPAKTGGITNNPHESAGPVEPFAIRTAFDYGEQAANKAAKRIAAQLGINNQDIVDKIAERGQDVAYLSGQGFARGAPEAAHDEAWQANLKAHIKKQVELAVNSFGQMYAKHAVAQDAARRVTGNVDPNSLSDSGLNVAAGNAEQFLNEKAVMALAARDGGPLDGMKPEAQSEIAQMWIRQRALELRKASGLPLRGKDIPGRTLGDLAKARFVALNGEPAWLAMRPAERNSYAREMDEGERLTEKVETLHEYLRQQADLARLGDKAALPGSQEAGHLNTDMLMKAASFVTHLVNTAGEKRAFYSRSDIQEDRQWGSLQTGIRRLIDTGERGMTTRVFQQSMDMEARGKRDLENMARRVKSDEWIRLQKGMSDEAKYLASDYLSGGAFSNKGEELPDELRDAAYKAGLDQLPRDQQEMVRRAVELSRGIYDDVAGDVEALRPEIRLKAKNYFPMTHDPLAKLAALEGAKSVPESLLNSVPEFGDMLSQAQQVAQDDTDANYARLKEQGKPFAENLLHRKPGEKDTIAVDHDPLRAASRYAMKMQSWVNATRFSQYIDKELGGQYAPIKVRDGDTARDVFARFTSDAVAARDAIKIDGRYYRVASGGTGDDWNMQLKVLGGGGRFDAKTKVVNGNLAMEVRPSQWDPETETFQPRGKFRPVQPEIRQGGISQIPSYSDRSRSSVEKSLTLDLGRQPTKDEIDQEMVGGGRAHQASIQALRDVLTRVIPPLQVTAVEKVVRRALKLTAISTLALSPGVAAHIAVAGNVAALSELGPNYFVRAFANAPKAEMRSWMKDSGGNLDPLSARRMLDPNAPFGERTKAFALTALSKAYWPMQQAHRLTRSIVLAGARLRANDEFDRYAKDPGSAPAWQQQQMGELARGWSLRGITDLADMREAYARQQAIAAAERTGTMMSAVSTPQLWSSPSVRLLTQFMRPAIQTFNTGMQMVGREPGQGNLSHLARFLAVGALTAWVDRKLRTNTSWTQGPRIADLGDDWFGASPGTVFPKLNDPTSWWHVAGDVRLPFQTPLGLGPVVTTARDVSRSTAAWLQGDDDTLGKQWWLRHNMDRKLERAWIPGFKTASDMAAAFAPGSALSQVKPSGDPDAPWASFDESGRLTYRTTREELARRAFGGTVASDQNVANLEFAARMHDQESIDRADKSAQKQRYIQLVQQFRATGDPKAAEEGRMLEERFGFTGEEADRAARMNALPPWGRALQGLDDNHRFDTIYRRYQDMKRLGSSPREIMEVTNEMLHDIGRLSDDRRAAGVVMYRDLEKRVGTSN